MLGQINPQIKISQKSMFDISSILVSAMVSDKSFIEHLSQVMLKVVREFEFQSQLYIKQMFHNFMRQALFSSL